MPEELPFIEYHSDEDYERSLSLQIKKMIKYNKEALQKNQLVAERTKKWFDCKFVRSKTIIYKVGDFVLMNIKNRFKDLKPGQVQWIGPCCIILERKRGLFDLLYEINNNNQIFYRVHPEFLKLYVRQVS